MPEPASKFEAGLRAEIRYLEDELAYFKREAAETARKYHRLLNIQAHHKCECEEE